MQRLYDLSKFAQLDNGSQESTKVSWLLVQGNSLCVYKFLFGVFSGRGSGQFLKYFLRHYQ